MEQRPVSIGEWTVGTVGGRNRAVAPSGEEMMKVQSYKELVAWQKSVDLVAEIYRCSKAFPREEVYGLSAQLRRAAISIPSNIAEGQARLSTGEFRQFLSNARGSLAEVETQIVIAQKLEYLKETCARDLLRSTGEVGRILNGLINSL